MSILLVVLILLLLILVAIIIFEVIIYRENFAALITSHILTYILHIAGLAKFIWAVKYII